MIVSQHSLAWLSHASYVIGDGASGRAVGARAGAVVSFVAGSQADLSGPSIDRGRAEGL